MVFRVLSFQNYRNFQLDGSHFEKVNNLQILWESSKGKDVH